MFVTGQREVEHLCARLRAKYTKSRHAPKDAAVQPGELQAPLALPQRHQCRVQSLRRVSK